MGHDLKNMTANKALSLAFAASGKSREDIGDEVGLGYETIARYFNPNDNYQPSLRHIPALCRALGNNIIAEWVLAQLEDGCGSECIETGTGAMSAITTLGKEFGDVCTSLSRSLEDGRFEPKEARDMVGELRDVERVAREAREGLEEFAGQQFIGGKWVSVPGKARN